MQAQQSINRLSVKYVSTKHGNGNMFSQFSEKNTSLRHFAPIDWKVWLAIGELEHGDVFAYYRGVGAQRAIAEQNRDL